MESPDELHFADSTEFRPAREFARKPNVGSKTPLVVVKKTPYSRPSHRDTDDKRKVIEVVLPRRASENLLRRCFRKPGGMRDLVTREHVILGTSDEDRSRVAERWRQNLELITDCKSLRGDAVEGRRTQSIFEELFDPKAAHGEPPTELFISCGVAPELLFKVLGYHRPG
jgi:hypothetical protein